MMNVGITFGFLVLTFYIWYEAIAFQNQTYLQLATVQIVWCVYFALSIIGTMYLGNAVAQEVRVFSTLHKIMSKRKFNVSLLWFETGK